MKLNLPSRLSHLPTVQLGIIAFVWVGMALAHPGSFRSHPTSLATHHTARLLAQWVGGIEFEVG